MDVITDIEHIDKNYTFDSCQFEKLDFAGGSLIDKCFYSSVFIDCKLSDCDINDSQFRDCQFINCDLSLSRFINTGLHSVKFTNCVLRGIDWTTILWTKQFSKKRAPFPVSFHACMLNYSIFIGLDLYAAVFSDSTLKEVSFEDTNLERADFSNVNLQDAIFLNTVLKHADLSSATNYNINGAVNSIEGAKFSFPGAMDLIYALGVDIV